MTAGYRAAFVYKLAAVAALGGLLFGYDTGVISGAILFINRDFGLTTHASEITVSIVLIGAIVGSLSAGYIADRLGRRFTLILAGCVFAAGALLSTVAVNDSWLLASRLLVGVAIGISSVTSPLYISEVSPAEIRGALVSLYQFAITIGILFAFVVDFMLASSAAWRLMLGVAVVPSALLIAGMIRMPETPRFLYKEGRDEAALVVLQAIRGDENTQMEVAAIRLTLSSDRGGGFAALFASDARYALAIGIGLAVLQQVTGINTVIYYGPQIFRLAGFQSNSASILATVIVGIVNVLLTIVAIRYSDRIGRKPLLYAGCTGMAIALAALAAAFGVPAVAAWRGTIAICSLMLYVGCFAFSLGPIAWLLISEIYPLRVRGLGMSVATLANWAANFVVSLYFLTMIERLGAPATFSVYAVLCLVTVAFIRFAIPETKLQELESISVRAR